MNRPFLGYENTDSLPRRISLNSKTYPSHGTWEVPWNLPLGAFRVWQRETSRAPARPRANCEGQTCRSLLGAGQNSSGASLCWLASKGYQEEKNNILVGGGVPQNKTPIRVSKSSRAQRGLTMPRKGQVHSGESSENRP